jgi:hypothetical protein
VISAIVIGVGATLLMDLWNLFLKRTFNIPSLNYCLLGRWVSYLLSGTFRHASIAAAPQKPHRVYRRLDCPLQYWYRACPGVRPLGIQ